MNLPLISGSLKETSFEIQVAIAIPSHHCAHMCTQYVRHASKEIFKLLNNFIILFSGSHTNSHSRTLAYRDADVFMLCFKIAETNTLLSALNFWCQEIRSRRPGTPIVLVGCQADIRNDRYRQGKAPVSADQALTFCQQIGGATYIETSARTSLRNCISAFEVAAMASMGKFNNKQSGNASSHLHHHQTLSSTSSPGSTPSPRTIKKQRFSSISPGHSLDRTNSTADHLEHIIEPSEHFWEQFQSPRLLPRSHSECPKTPSLASSSSRSASLSSKTRSSCSIPSITNINTNNSSSTLGGCYNTTKTPKCSRRGGSKNNLNNQEEKTVTIKCQRLTADKTYEEIEVEVPAPIYETIQLYNDKNSEAGFGSLNARSKERRSFGHKLRNFFTTRTWDEWMHNNTPFSDDSFRCCDNKEDV